MRKRKIVQFKEIVGNSGEVIVGNMCAHCEFLFLLFREQVRKVTGVIRCENLSFVHSTLNLFIKHFFHLASAICIKK